MSLLPTACKYPNCPEITKDDYCNKHKGYEKKVKKEYERLYQSKRDPFYNSPAWINARKRYRRRHPLCEDCLKKGLIVPMKIVDHIIPIKQGGAKLDPKNFKSLCQTCHNIKIGLERRKK